MHSFTYGRFVTRVRGLSRAQREANTSSHADAGNRSPPEDMHEVCRGIRASLGGRVHYLSDRIVLQGSPGLVFSEDRRPEDRNNERLGKESSDAEGRPN